MTDTKNHSEPAREAVALRQVRDALEEAQIALNGGPITQGLASQIEAALRTAHYTLALEWDERRNYIMPYRVRDKLRAALSLAREE